MEPIIRSHKKPGFRGLEEAMTFGKTPADYGKLMNTLWKSRDFNKLEEASAEFWENCLKLAKRRGIKFENYTTIGDIRI